MSTGPTAEAVQQDVRCSKRTKVSHTPAPSTHPVRGSRKARPKVASKTQPSTTEEAVADVRAPRPIGGDSEGSILRFMKELPLDVLLEIFSHLQPADLIHLSRTTKALRAIMMCRSARSIWTQALSSIPDLPPCPDDLIEAQYANLMFTDYCHECLATNDEDPTLILFMFMEARTQLCDSCAPKKFKCWDSLPDLTSDFLVEFIPATSQSFNKKGYWWGDGRDKFSVDIAVQLTREYTSLAEDEREGWILQQRKKWKAVAAHAEACESYVTRREELEKQRLRSVTRRRNEQIIQRLKALGMGGDLDHTIYVLLLRHPLVDGRFKNVISDKEWEYIEPELVEWVEEHKKARLHKEKQVVVERRVRELLFPIYSDFVASRPSQTIHPSVLEVALLDDFCSIIEGAPANTNPTAELTQLAQSKLSDFFDSWRERHDNSLIQLTQKSSLFKNQKVTKATLLQATTVFKCIQCDRGLIYPDVLAHFCNYKPLVEPSTSTSTSKKQSQSHSKKRKRALSPVQTVDYNNRAPGSMIKRVVKEPLIMSTDNIRFNEAGYHHTLHLLDMVGLERDTTAVQLQKKGPWVDCHCACYFVSVEPSPRTMRWPMLLEPCADHRRGGYTDCYQLIKDESLIKPKKVEAHASSALMPQLCPMCGYQESLTGLYRHMSHRHGIPIAVADKYITSILGKS